MSPFIGAAVQVPPARYSTPWMPLGSCETAIAGQYRCAPFRNPILMSPEYAGAGMNCQDTWRLFQCDGYRSGIGAPFFTNLFSESFDRSRWYLSSRHQALESPQLSATIMSRVPSLYASGVHAPLRQNACPSWPSLTPVQ